MLGRVVNSESSTSVRSVQKWFIKPTSSLCEAFLGLIQHLWFHCAFKFLTKCNLALILSVASFNSQHNHHDPTRKSDRNLSWAPAMITLQVFRQTEHIPWSVDNSRLPLLWFIQLNLGILVRIHFDVDTLKNVHKRLFVRMTHLWNFSSFWFLSGGVASSLIWKLKEKKTAKTIFYQVIQFHLISLCISTVSSC